MILNSRLMHFEISTFTNHFNFPHATFYEEQTWHYDQQRCQALEVIHGDLALIKASFNSLPPWVLRHAISHNAQAQILIEYLTLFNKEG